MIRRLLEDRMDNALFKGRVVTLFGARRVGKTTLVRQLLERHRDKHTRYLNCDLASVRTGLEVADAEPMKAFIGDSELVVLDEAQGIPEIGRKLKILVDTYPEMQIVATGSSSFQLQHQTGEPLTGRATPFELYPMSLQEIAAEGGYSAIDPRLERLLRFGEYPEMLDLSEDDARQRLEVLVSDYLYRDIFAFMDLRRSSTVENLLRLLALQLGQQVSYGELATILGIDRRTVERYIDILEQSYVLFRLPGFSRNLRKEVGRTQKIYFYDTGIRNALLQAFAPLALRDDVGALWENFCIMERRKLLHYQGIRFSRYFWRTYDQKEIDYVEEHEGRLTGFECKWSPGGKMRIPREFLEAYPGSEVKRIDRGNYWKFLL